MTLADVGNSTQADSGGTGFTITETTAGSKTAGSNMASYNVAAIDQATDYYFGGGISHSRTESTSNAWDPDASGPAPSIPFVTSTSSGNPAGIGTAYDSSHNLLYAVTWDTTGYDIISAIATTNDGSNGAFWAGEKLDECHIELRNAAGDVVWSDTFDMSPAAGDPPVPGVERIFRVQVQSNGDLLVSGYFENGGAGGGTAAYDNFVRKYEKTGVNAYAVQWTKTIVNAGTRELGYDTALDAGEDTLYLLSDAFGTLPNVTGFVRTETNVNNNDLLVQKLTPGDFNTDGLVDFADVQLAGTATKPGLPGVDTYDFNGDGDSTLADTTYMITNIMDRAVGDIAQDPLATDVDNADIGKAIGGLITSFQLENNQGTFVPAGYNGPPGGSFGGSLKDVTANVIADTDLTLTGFNGIPSLGKVFPAGMAQAGLEAYLTSAVYTGQPGSGQLRFKPVVAVIPVDYETWAATFPTLTDPDPGLDFDFDGLVTGLEFVLGGNPTLNDAGAVTPLPGNAGSNLDFTFRRTDFAKSDPTTAIMVEYATDLATWSPALPGVDGVTLVENDNFYGPAIDQVIVTLPPSLAANGRIFARLKVTITPPVTLLDADFETGDGGFTVVTAGGTPWAYGDPESPDGGGGEATTYPKKGISPAKKNIKINPMRRRERLTKSIQG